MGAGAYSVSEWDGSRHYTDHGICSSYAEAREHARQLSSRGVGRDKAFRIVDASGDVVAVARNGKVTNRDGTGPDVDLDGK
jgi:hypothetical protein